MPASPRRRSRTSCDCVRRSTAQVDSDGKLFASFKQQLSPLTLLTLVSEVDTVNLNEGKHKFGMAMGLTP